VNVWEPWLLGYAVLMTVFVLCTGLVVFRSASSRFAEMA
jgi:hypothetical protein